MLSTVLEVAGFVALLAGVAVLGWIAAGALAAAAAAFVAAGLVLMMVGYAVGDVE